jgi:glycosyltransferase involved in cell wall biosynthesis
LRRRYPPYLTHVPLSYAALRAGSYELAHAVYPADALAAVRWSRKTGRPAVLTYLGIPDRRDLTAHRRKLDIFVRVLEGCDAVVALSDYAAEAFRHWLGYEPRVIAPGVDVRAFQPRDERAPRPTIVCSAAAEVPRKHVGLLIDAFQLLRSELPDARLVLSRPRDPAAARRAGVQLDAPGVEWADLDDRELLARAYAEAWVAALPSQDEAFGLVLAEALACGTPVVGYAHGAIPEVLNGNDTGRLFDRLEPEALADVLLDATRLVQDPETAARCRARAEQFSIDRCTGQYLALYRELMG